MTGLPRRRGMGDRFLVGRGLDPKVQVGLGAWMGVPVLVALVFEFAALGPALLAPGTGGWSEWGWWALFFGLLVACALAAPVSLALLQRGMAGLSGPSSGPRRRLLAEWPMPTSDAAGRGEKRAERQLLEAIDRHGEITPARAALETPLTVAEADRMLSDLAEGGYLEVRVEGGKLLYGL